MARVWHILSSTVDIKSLDINFQLKTNLLGRKIIKKYTKTWLHKYIQPLINRDVSVQN